MSGAPILLVEDNPDEALLARRALRSCNLTTDLVVAGSGEEALSLLFQYPDAPGSLELSKPVLVLLDLKLPGIDGIEVLRRIRADARTRTLPVIVLSSSRAQADVAACYEHGVNGFVQKAVDFDEFQESMKALTAYWLRVNVSPSRLP
ncbi:MAG: response regulator [Thermoanaerobaculia bacterium]